MNQDEETCDQESPALNKGLNFRNIIESIIAGQFLSLLNAGTNIFTQLLNSHDIYVSLFPNELVYHLILLLALFKSRYIWNYYRENKSKLPWLVAMAVADFSANVAVLMAFESTSALSVMLITSSSVIFAMFLSIIIFQRQYLSLHYISMFIVILGIALINYSKWVQNPSDHSIALKGTLLAFAAAFGYALSNVLQEYVSLGETGYPYTTLGGMGLFGSFFSLIITQGTAQGVFDRDKLIHAPTLGKYWVVGYISCMVLLYTLVPVYLQRYNAIRFNFSMLTADMYVFLFCYIYPLTDHLLDVFYIAGFLSVLVGLFVFNIKQPLERLMFRSE